MSSDPKVTFERRYRCYVPSMDVETFYDAKSAAAARYLCWKAAREAGYRLNFGDIRVRLAYVAEEAMNYFTGRRHEGSRRGEGGATQSRDATAATRQP